MIPLLRQRKHTVAALIAAVAVSCGGGHNAALPAPASNTGQPTTCASPAYAIAWDGQRLDPPQSCSSGVRTFATAAEAPQLNVRVGETVTVSLEPSPALSSDPAVLAAPAALTSGCPPDPGCTTVFTAVTRGAATIDIAPSPDPRAASNWRILATVIVDE